MQNTGGANDPLLVDNRSGILDPDRVGNVEGVVMPAFRTIADIARTLAISPRTVARMCVAGDMPAYRVGQSGENNPNATLTDADVARIVSRFGDGWTNTQIGAEVGVSHAMISRIRLGKSWRDVTERIGYTPRASYRAPKSGKTGVKKWV